MANKKRKKTPYLRKLNRFYLDKRELLIIEEILRDFADVRELKLSGLNKQPDDYKHMPRKYTDRNVKIGKYMPFYFSIYKDGISYGRPNVDWILTTDGVKFLPKDLKATHYMRLACDPGISVTFKPFSTVIYAQTHFATGIELKAMNECVKRIEDFLVNRERSYINYISFR